MSIDYACMSHVQEATLATRIEDWVDPGTACDLCGDLGAVEFSLIEDVVHGAVTARFKPAQEWNAPWEEIESGSETRLYDLVDILDGELALFDAVDGELYAEIEGSFGYDTQWVTKFEVDMRPSDKDVLGWNEFRALIKHKSRYLQFEEQSFVARMQGVPAPRQMLRRVTDLIDHHQLYRTLQPEVHIWRGRTFDVEKPSWSAADLASAPPSFAAQSRMSAAGISVFYGAFDIETVAAELAGDTRPWLMAGAFHAIRPLRVVDLTRLPPYPSPFMEQSDAVTEDLLFLQSFARDVSRPVETPELIHIEYAPIQIVAEFLRFSFLPLDDSTPVDGIIYQSSAHDGECVVLFADHTQCIEAPAVGSRRHAEQLLQWVGPDCEVRRHLTWAQPSGRAS